MKIGIGMLGILPANAKLTSSTNTINQHKDSAAYHKEYRKRRKDAGNAVSRGGADITKFTHGEFISWDGEGVDTQSADNIKSHQMILWANSLGDIIVYPDRRRLDGFEILALIIDTAKRNPNAIHVIYGGGYDFTHILRGLRLSKIQMRKLMGESAKMMTHSIVKVRNYLIEYVPRKYFRIRWLGVEPRKKKDDKYRPDSISVTIWDCIGFFQNTFLNAMKTWLDVENEDYQLIAKGKDLRHEFSRVDLDFITEYNNAELRQLVRLMQKLRGSVLSLSLQLRRWDGAGAIAAAILRNHNIKDHIPNERLLPRQLVDASRYAYFGGRVECLQVGIYRQIVYSYDINSAYPTIIAKLPSLTNGTWIPRMENSSIDGINDFALVHIRWRIPKQYIVMPFPYRDTTGNISFPPTGDGWYWMPLVREALRYYGNIGEFTILEVWEYVSNNPTEFPFAFVEEYYNVRQAIQRGLRPDLPNGCEHTIKLGLNSLYGKLAQSAGYNPANKRTPPYHCMLYAGFITASTQAKIFAAGMQQPDQIIAFMTDGILSRMPLDVPISESKELGKWEHKTYDGMISVQSGLYARYTHKNDEWYLRSRGVDRPDDKDKINHLVQTLESLYSRHDWSKQEWDSKLVLSFTRLITPRAALVGRDLYTHLGDWITTTKEINLHFGKNGKRRWIKGTNPHPSHDLCISYPNSNLFCRVGFDGTEIWQTSQPYVRPWDFHDEYWQAIEQDWESVEGIRQTHWENV